MTSLEKLNILARKNKMQAENKKNTIKAFAEIRKIMVKCRENDYKFCAKSFRQIHKIIGGIYE